MKDAISSLSLKHESQRALHALLFALVQGGQLTLPPCSFDQTGRCKTLITKPSPQLLLLSPAHSLIDNCAARTERGSMMIMQESQPRRFTLTSASLRVIASARFAWLALASMAVWHALHFSSGSWSLTFLLVAYYVCIFGHI